MAWCAGARSGRATVKAPQEDVTRIRSEPTVDERFIRNAVHHEYGLELKHLVFFPSGSLAYCYRAEGISGGKYLLKLYDESLPSSFLATSRDFYLPLTYQLYTKGLLQQIPCPVRTKDGNFYVRVGLHLLVLLGFIEGAIVGVGDMPDSILMKLAGLVGRLHRSTNALDLVNPMVEGFTIAFEKAFPEEMKAFLDLRWSGRESREALQMLLFHRRQEILSHLERLKELRRIVISSHRNMVICHADLHGNNLLQDENGCLYILDWEGAMLAPPEQDLFFFTSKDSFWNLFLPVYEHEFGPVSLDVPTLGFYYYRRGLEDLADWIHLLLHVDHGEVRDRTFLYKATKTIDFLSDVEATLVRISARLDHL